MWFKVIHLPALKADGMALYPFILVKKAAHKTNPLLINHEKIHLMQQMELLVMPFYLLYLLHYIFNLVRYRQHDKAYRNIIFEREAYQMESRPEYLKSRPFWAWIKFL